MEDIYDDNWKLVFTTIKTDVGIDYDIYYLNNQIAAIMTESQTGTPILLGDIFSVKDVEWTPIATRAGWTVNMDY